MTARRRATTKPATPALMTLSAEEKAAVLDELLATRPELREHAESCASRLLADEDRAAVAREVTEALRGLDIEYLHGRAGYQPGRGYVHPVQAADELMDDALRPFLHDLERLGALGLGAAAAELASGILLGLAECRDDATAPLLEYSPDYADERAAEVADLCAGLGVPLPAIEPAAERHTGQEH